MNTFAESVESTIESWMDFCQESIRSPFYQHALASTGNREKAAALTLFWLYLNTFPDSDRERIENDPDLFLEYARSFIRELAPFRYKREGYNRAGRKLLLGKIRRVSREFRSGDPSDQEMLTFFRNIVRFCSSLDFIVHAYDEYRSHRFRNRPDIPYHGYVINS